jgi:hypothetical protein
MLMVEKLKRKEVNMPNFGLVIDSTYNPISYE